ncbi:MAG: DUF503 domain-containing protein [Planctomycetota bacterium]
MIVGVLQAELRIDWARSLKDKRTVARSLKDRLHRSHQVSVAEVGAQEVHNALLLGVAAAGSSGPQVAAMLDGVQRKLGALGDAELVACQREVLNGWAGQLAGGAFSEEECQHLENEMLSRAPGPEEGQRHDR